MGIPDPRRNVPVAEVCYRDNDGERQMDVLCQKPLTAPYARTFVASKVTCPQCLLLLNVARANRISTYHGGLRKKVLEVLNAAESGADVWTANANR